MQGEQVLCSRAASGRWRYKHDELFSFAEEANGIAVLAITIRMTRTRSKYVLDLDVLRYEPISIQSIVMQRAFTILD